MNGLKLTDPKACHLKTFVVFLNWRGPCLIAHGLIIAQHSVRTSKLISVELDSRYGLLQEAALSFSTARAISFHRTFSVSGSRYLKATDAARGR